MQATAILRTVRLSPQKGRLIADQILGGHFNSRLMVALRQEGEHGQGEEDVLADAQRDLVRVDG